jgi:hypothetical protein
VHVDFLDLLFFLEVSVVVLDASERFPPGFGFLLLLALRLLHDFLKCFNS